MQLLSGSERIQRIGGMGFLTKIVRAIHTGYGLILFVILFLLLFPLFLIPIISPANHKIVGILNRIWARILMTLVFLPYQVESRTNLQKERQYIFCPNHFSYFDIPVMGLNPHNTVFVGKNDMEKIPLFGFMYRKLHITVDRSRLRSRYTTILESRQALEEGKSLVIYPEGGILSTRIPEMSHFRDGAFRLAIEKQIPIVPVTIPFNWIILPDSEFLLRWHRVKVIFHEPIETSGMSMDDVGQLKSRTQGVIDRELKLHLQDEN